MKLLVALLTLVTVSITFAPIAEALVENESVIVAELAAPRGNPADTGGYYHTDADKTAAVMRSSATLNRIMG